MMGVLVSMKLSITIDMKLFFRGLGGSFGSFFVACWGPAEVVGGLLGASWVLLRASWGSLLSFWSHFGALVCFGRADLEDNGLRRGKRRRRKSSL